MAIVPIHVDGVLHQSPGSAPEEPGFELVWRTGGSESECDGLLSVESCDVLRVIAAESFGLNAGLGDLDFNCPEFVIF